MPKKTLHPLKWELKEGEYIDETGIADNYVTIYFNTLLGEIQKYEFSLKAMSEHYLLLDDFFIKKGRDQKDGGGEQIHTHYELLELLEKSHDGE